MHAASPEPSAAARPIRTAPSSMALAAVVAVAGAASLWSVGRSSAAIDLVRSTS